MSKISFFLPTRKGSQRVKDKNIRPFANYKGGLLENKITQLLDTKKIDEIILSTNDEECIVIAERFKKESSRLLIIERPDSLCLDTTNLQDLIRYVPTITDADHILWGHVTTPICGAEDYDAAVELYLSKLKDGYDSLVSVSELKNFLLDADGRLMNNNTSIPWPRTQDLQIIYEINHAMFIAKREIYITKADRLGNNVLLHVMNKLKSIDVDWPEDFNLAEHVYENLYNK